MKTLSTDIFLVAGVSLAVPAESRLATTYPWRPGTKPSLATAAESQPREGPPGIPRGGSL